ncbi:acetyl/propionyl/methylcrotonyl-CoA carboxylase subunit alpha [Agrococcus lahaulensis]|uniref:acetyl/propionyl/methylcrotonyl-CoA carboxylase subunit alpha n=1 Tax=Agrococcus lahaulensis TaxID=341722 RepID=UPI0004793F07|nr:biotin carboxylase N-terminal domain-containing protein [Agrococcus lahaulensis]
MQKVLIANRGEIAVRIARACAEAGYRSVAVYADQDVDAMHVRHADEAVALGGSTAAETYLDADSLLAAARATGADAVHPGYGFLSESAAFARAVEGAGLTWIGPTPESIDALGDKVTARSIARRVGAPLVPGSDGPLADAGEAVAFAREHGLPIVIKAAFGGGGRGLRVARSIDEVADAFETAAREAAAAFGRAECFVERYLERPRHIEAQVLGDGRGGVVVVGDRDCSLQRRGQKLVEEAPAPRLERAQRERIHEAARAICAAVDYRGAGTVEFLLGADGTASFLEVNTRLQVEHPVTEAVTGVDLVREQLRIAEGLGPSIAATPEPLGHAIELRINAEDPGRGFLPSPGRIASLRVPGGPGVRWDAGVEAGDAVEAAFDSLVAKLVVHAQDRDAALVRLRRALGELEVRGVATIAPLAEALLDEPAFSTEGLAVSTQWIEDELMPRLEPQLRAAIAPAGGLTRVPIEVDGRRVVLGLPDALLAVAARAEPASSRAEQPEAEGTVRAPVPGTLARWLVPDGERVEAGRAVAVLDAMKLETRVAADRAGALEHLVAEGESVALDDAIARISE